jgi:hypothetical protein
MDYQEIMGNWAIPIEINPRIFRTSMQGSTQGFFAPHHHGVRGYGQGRFEQKERRRPLPPELRAELEAQLELIENYVPL